ncbi:calcium:proton antiporter [Bordetella sp. 15P40C-2]|uniref:calcium:proton antiporter n=1 Tax=Bordetella sp. 15P40C-2 TaxID=2572246 RepID=UPI001325A184|nr:calcium:proton antiporter [Bordetella sp. 15P40C-2]MVW71532.1 calcium:proton antiporter [Bordetella sp. 15P40C-2]
MQALLSHERLLVVAGVATAVAYVAGDRLITNGSTVAIASTVVLVLAIICASQRVAYHAEQLAHRLGDPYGTMVLTLAAVLVEVVVLAIVMSHETSPTLVRDTIYAAVMLDINGILGLAALMGGIKHGEQAYNDDSGRVYTVMILTAMAISMIMPEFVPADRWRLYSGFTIFIMIMLYAVFLRMQTGPHSYFFSYAYPEKRRPVVKTVPGPDTVWSVGLLITGVVLIGALSEVMAQSLNVSLANVNVPPALPALVVALISASPEILTALRAALANRMQSVVNIALGASLSTVILTVPLMEALALFTGQPFEMAMTPIQTMMVLITLVITAINLNDGQTNAIEGMTHFALFATFLMLTALGL